MAASSSPTLSWAEANRRYMWTRLDWLRLVLRRRALWLRSRWSEEGLWSGDGRILSDHQADLLLAGEDTEIVARFLATDPEAQTVTQAMYDLAEQVTQQRDAFTAAGLRPALDEVTHRCGLTALESHFLLLCLAPEVDPSFASLYAYAQDDLRRAYATLHLAGLLFGPGTDLALGDGVAHLALMNADGPLARFGLVRMGDGETAAPHNLRPVGIDERTRDFLLGIPGRDVRVAELVQPLADLPVTPAQANVADQIVQTLQRDEQVVVNLMGRTGTGKAAVAAAVALQLDRIAVKIDAAALSLLPDERANLLPRLAREALLSGWIYLVDVGELDLHDVALTRLVDQILALPVPTMLGSEDRWPRPLADGRTLLPVTIPKADAQAQALLWRQVLTGPKETLNGSVDQMVEQFDFGPSAIAATAAAMGNRGKLAPADLWQASREQARREMGDMAQRIEPLFTWDDIVLPQDVMAQLREMAAQVSSRAKVYERWGFRDKLSRGLGISALFAGPSGTGKTMAAEVLANHLRLDLYRIDLSAVVNKYIGETEKNLRRVFDAAEQGGAILFFDEADALFGKRTEVKDSHDRYANIEVNYLLQRMETYRGLAILATNRKSALDQAFLRRLRFVVDFPFPDATSRQHIWQGIFPAKAEINGLDFPTLARLEVPGGNIRNIAVNAAFLAADAGEPISMGHILRAARREYTKIDRLVTAAEFGSHGEVRP